MSLAAAELERLGPPAAKAGRDGTATESYRPSTKEQLYEALPDLLEADELRDENDILFIANVALQQGIKDPADLIAWLARAENLAKMSKMWVEDNKYQRPPPRVAQIAKYLRYVKDQEKKFPRA